MNVNSCKLLGSEGGLCKKSLGFKAWGWGLGGSHTVDLSKPARPQNTLLIRVMQIM